jgi:Ca2+:H+ antiporter
MAAGRLPKVLSWTVIVPVLAIVLLAFTWGHKIPALLEVVVALALAGAVLAAVNHAEIVAHRVGEPFGSLVLAIAVTIIEVGLIVTLMVSGGPGTASLARDTVFAAVMITCNGIVGIALLIGALRFHITVFNAEGSGAALATVITIGNLELGAADVFDQSPGPGVHSGPAGVCGDRIPGAVRGVRGYPDRTAPGLLPPTDLGGGGC